MDSLRTLVVYYSLSGASRAAAQALASKLNADLEEISPASSLGQGFMKYFRAGVGGALRQAWPVRPTRHALANYDCVIIGGPVWIGRVAAPVRGWLKANPLPPRAGFAAFLTLGGGTSCKQAFAEIDELAGRATAAHLEICERDAKSGRSAELIDGFVQSLAPQRRAA